VRFAAVLGFQIEPDTAAAICRHAPKLAQISRERIGIEVQKMLGDKNGDAASLRVGASKTSCVPVLVPARAMGLMQELELDGPALTEAHQNPKLPTVERLGSASVSASDGYAAALAAWALDRGPAPWPWDKAQVHGLVLRWRGALCLSNDDRGALAAILSLLPQALDWATLTTAQRKRLLGHEHWPAAWAVLAASAHRPAVAPVVEQISGQSAILHNQGVTPPPLVTGADLIALGLTPGPTFGRLLHAAYDAQLNGEVTTPDQARAWLRKHATGNAMRDKRT